MKLAAAFFLIGFALTGAASAQESAPVVKAAPVVPVATPEEEVVKATVLFCLPPVIKKFDAGTMAQAFKMREMPPENAIYFDREGGRVFAATEQSEDILLIAGKNGACSIVARNFDPVKFWVQAEKILTQELPFRLTAEKSIPGGKQKTYEADYEGPVVIFVSARDAPQPGMLQGILTSSRVKN